MLQIILMSNVLKTQKNIQQCANGMKCLVKNKKRKIQIKNISNIIFAQHDHILQKILGQKRLKIIQNFEQTIFFNKKNILYHII